MLKDFFKCIFFSVCILAAPCYPKKQFKEPVTASPGLHDVKCRAEDGYHRCVNHHGEMICTRRDYASRKCANIPKSNDDEVKTGRKYHSRFEVKRSRTNIYSRCHHDEYECKLTKECIPRSWIQDGEDDCSLKSAHMGIDDGSDETEFLESCHNQTEFHCSGQHPRCIPRHWVQDGDKDCPEGNDETTVLTCTNDTEFHCMYNSRCILRLMVNDGFPDCPNGTDERVRNFPCVEDLEFRCENGRCIPRVWVGNGLKDCSEGEDEMANLSKCFHNEFQCLYHTRCLPMDYLCDGVQNCLYGSDEIEMCGSPAMYRYSAKDQSLVPWSLLLFEDKAIIYSHYSDFESKHELMFGMKCYVGVYFHNVEQVSGNLRTIPQFYIENNISICYNKEDVCFDSEGKFSCSRCLDGTIIAESQVCDGVVDCHDLSDECPCESSRVKELCEVLPSRNKTKSELWFHLICNAEEDLEAGVDEKFCERNVLQFKNQINFGRKVSGRNTEMACLSTNQTTALFCNGIIECPLMEDECNPECLIAKLFEYDIDTMQRFEIASSCYSFLGLPYECEDVVDDCVARFKVSNNEITIQNIEPTSGHIEGSADIYHDDDNDDTTCEYMVSLAYNGLYSYFVSGVTESTSCQLKGGYKNLGFLCDLEGVECPWFHVCEADKTKKIEVKKLCDYTIDCEDKSDERDCPHQSHFYCNNAKPLFIARRKVDDGVSDCSDRSDECKETAYASVAEMLKSIFLRHFIWVCAISILICNTIVMRKHFRKMATLTSKRTVAYCNTLLLMNLALSDMMFGVTLLLVGVKSHQFSGKYCEFDLEWRSSSICNMIGISTVISSQTSMHFLVVMTGLRLYITYKPFMTNRLDRNAVLLLCLMSWVVAAFIATYPVWGNANFVHSFYIEQSTFLNDQIVSRTHLNEYVSATYDIASLTNVSYSGNIKPSHSFIAKVLGDWYFNTQRGKTDFPQRNVIIKGHFGFYSTSSVCFPDLYTHISPASEYSLAIVLLNFAFLVFIGIGYSIIFLRTRKSKQLGRTREEAVVDKKDSKMLRRIIYIVLSDTVCWFPIILMTVISYTGYDLPGIIHAVSAIVFLPINSLINPVIYSRLDKVIWKKIVQLFSPIFDQCKETSTHATEAQNI